MNIERIKIILLGSAGVGKSSILYTYVTGSFNDKADPTIAASFISKTIIVNDVSIRLDIWDTAGQEKYFSFAKLYCRGARAILLVYDSSDFQSFTDLEKMLKMVKEENNEPDVKIFIAAAKIDIVGGKYQIPDAVNTFANTHNAIIFKVSAKLNQGINELFNAIGNSVRFASKRATTPHSSISLNSAVHTKASINTIKTKKKCCK